MKKSRALFLIAFIVFISASAYATDCNNGGRYEDNADGTVTDCRTGLIWLKNAMCTDTSNGIANPNGYLNWYDAMTWTKGLGSGLCGLTDGSSAGDWRLPTKTEWMAMVAYAKSRFYNNPTLTNGAGTGQWIAGDVFTNVMLTYYWSSTTGAGDTSSAWLMGMWGGILGYDNKTYYYFYVWPIRGGQSGEVGSLIIQ